MNRKPLIFLAISSMFFVAIACRASIKDEAIRSFIMEAELEMAIDRFQRLQIPEDTRSQLQLYCSANTWMEKRILLVKEGGENYTRLLTIRSVIVSNMLSDLTALAGK
ncbi:MAG: hypothetical protein AAFY48_06015 [Bacteroidota bacterium]